MMFLFFLLLSLVLISCGSADAGKWVNSKVNENYVDVFYVTSTCVLSSCLSDGTETYNAVLNDEEVNYLTQEDLFVRDGIFGDSLNFFAPIYRQFTLSSIDLPKDKFDSIYAFASQEVCDAFDYYMEHMNGGRRFILAGFSQGAMHLRSIMEHMTDEQYSRMVAAYMMGYGLSEEDCRCCRIVPATDGFSTGVTVSFNSVADTMSVWPFVHNNTIACINPVNWRTDNVTADFLFGDDSLKVAVDTAKNVLVVSGFDESKYPLSFNAPWPEGCLHHFEIFFYNDALHRNALDRAYRGK